MTAPRALPLGHRASAGPRRGPAVLVGLLTVLLLAVGMPSAQAHDALVRSSPAPSSAVPVAPSAVELEFSGTPLPLGTEVLVLGPDGGAVSTGAAQIRGTTVVQPLSAGLPAGSYTVEWRSTSSDGHPLTGSWGFTVATGSAPAPAADSDPAPAAGSDSATGTDADPTSAADAAPAATSAAAAAPAATSAAAAASDSSLPAGWLLGGVLALGAAAVLVVVPLRRRS
ncbi:hypothetical protein GCM10023328_12980 [Modestobacter marinus]|uniref:CopC domain-containing protein n=1 Tax=Modestobacter marinus TaxID=477641 RepID=A0A846LNP9_9ACTN|nr:copper resistance CopC family protein [Modestobacter marinus]NIH69067.1 hypothetical protein [Modestobacter marinus]GGL77821.1 hypothetical protein GCM10011589_37320 [Modestobacter marinus]